MSHNYEMLITVEGHDVSKFDDIRDAVAGLGYQADAVEQLGCIQFSREEINVSGISGDATVAREVAIAIWNANGSFCKVTVTMRDLEEPVPTYTWDEDGYDEVRTLFPNAFE